MKKLFFILTTFIFFVFMLISSEKTFAAGTARIVFDSQTPSVSAQKSMDIIVSIESDTPVNALDLRLTYPARKLRLVSIDTTNSKFSIKAEETKTNGLITIARGNIQAHTGENEVAVLKFQSLQKANISDIGFTSDSVVMSENAQNILSGSTIKTIPVAEPTKSAGTTQTKRISFFEWIKQSTRSFFGKFSR